MSDRKAELERKKEKLRLIREEKERRRREKEQKDVEEAALRTAVGGLGIEKDQRKELDQMLSSLGVAPVSDVLSSLSSMSSLTSETGGSNNAQDSSQQNTAPPPTSHRKRVPQLSVVSVQSTNIPPKEIVTYAKQTQTAHTGHERDGWSASSSPLKGYYEDWWRPRKAHAFDYYDEYNLNPGLEWEDEFTAEDEEGSLPHLEGGGLFQSKLPPGILPHGLPRVKEVQPAVTSLEHEATKQQEQVRELSEEEKQMIILSEDFQRFFDRSARIMERALCESVDIYTDYTGVTDNEEGTDEKSNARLSLNRWFYDERWSRNRCVTSMDWSPQFPELLVASYHNNEDSPNDPDGVCLIWNTKFKKRTPEYIFHCQSPVMSSIFARFHPNLILGGTYSGQIVLWDNRVQKRTPIQRTPLSSAAHTHPVYCLSVVGTQNAHNLISVSTDGRLCSWSLDMLSKPQETLELHHKQGKPVAATCLAFPHGDVNNFVVGSEEGAVYSACRHGSKAGVTESYEGHQGPVTGISTHSVQGGIDFSHLFLTSSFDWTVKLWSQQATEGKEGKDRRPLYSFEDNGDYVYDVAWSPIHPALFATADGTGRLDLWNLNQDTEVPTASITVDGNPALNRVSWTPSGLHVTVGDDMGKIWVFDVGEQLAQPRLDEWSKFVYTLQELRNNQADDDIDKLSVNSGPGSLSSLSSSPLR
ncbi:cytoplasmic dynein 1 intermediate chain-like isoform X3 [Schistocerca serialis cubense]|uniref:cytoplasmic dynein 1 intermediate chain isoform X6 n=1 Tax=Schistocerca cancellata TaxID=274614 RepID=UPI0021172D6C|nr:cytoplasmic dynein 1 intermediate chain isoform X6 [Schistocerca cancellata]XP_049938620.1 cytoplasmic dynein 1 intermediate chain-like isoform X3 [Schistocerca serialis cubense]